ncbi:putative bzip transcription [Phaeomoniella chlamydospora]|uniref:Putative bzip transcription n=1 Tax=Phaeomoniella chlamydospora TaxID=158046 RepID=A0A0G2EW73_PHACM|nr:putative bzip transcription [Phaeomoniella chlamydospora]
MDVNNVFGPSRGAFQGSKKSHAPTEFEIPKDRNLGTIDSLISHYTQVGDESQVKELKQQKRLLRNRQAALDSRQRKKQHTEELEREKGRHMEFIKQLEDDLDQHKMTVSDLLMQQANWQQQEDFWRNRVAYLEQQSDELARTTTLELEELRRQNRILREHVEEMEQNEHASQQAAPVSDFSQFEQLPIDTNGTWDGFGVHSSMKIDPEDVLAQHPSSYSTSQTVPNTEVPPTNSSNKNEYPFSWNTFYMCLLFGAFIVSNTKSASSSKLPQKSSITLPALSEEYRDESANVLKAVLASAPGSDRALQQHRQDQNNPTTISASELANLHRPSGDSLSSLHTSLASVTRSQQEIQAFSLTPSQYASITGMDSHHPNPYLSDPAAAPSYSQQQQSSTPKPRHQPTPLQRAFAALKTQQDQLDRTIMPGVWDRSAVAATTTNQSGGSMGIWEQVAGEVPEKVVRDFRRIVGQVNPADEKRGG